MASCRDTVSGALRMIGKLGSGREPRLADQTDTLAALQGAYRQLISSGAFGRLYDVIPKGDYQAGENERIFRNSSATNTIQLPEVVRATGNPRPYEEESDYYVGVRDKAARPPADCSVVVVSDAFTGITVDFIYDGNVKQWQPIHELTLDDHAPLSHRNPLGLQAFLAGQVVDQFGGQLGPGSLAQAASFMTSLTTRYDSFRQERVCGGAFTYVPTPGLDGPALKFNNLINSQYFAAIGA